jgi:hypothetical protein
MFDRGPVAIPIEPITLPLMGSPLSLAKRHFRGRNGSYVNES